jgi:hypothetical protein
VGDGAAHANVAQLRRRRALGGGEVEEDDAHRAAGDDLQRRHDAHLLGLVGRDVHDEVEAARQHLGDLGLPVRDEADDDALDLRLRLRAVAEIVGVALQSVIERPIWCSTTR